MVFLVLVFPDLVEIQVVDHTVGVRFSRKARTSRSDLPNTDAASFPMRTLSDQAEYLRGREENRLVLIRKRAHPVAPRFRDPTSRRSRRNPCSRP